MNVYSQETGKLVIASDHNYCKVKSLIHSNGIPTLAYVSWKIYGEI